MTEEIPEHSQLHTRQSLLARLLNGPQDRSWRDFFVQYRQYVLSAAARQRLGEDQAHDVLQLVMMVVLREAGGFHYDPETRTFRNAAVLKEGEVHEFRRFRAWLKGVVQIKIWEVKKFTARGGAGLTDDADEQLEQLPDDAPTPDEAAAESSDLAFQRAMLDQALQSLRESYGGSERNLEMFEKIAREGMSYSEAAQKYGVTEVLARGVVHKLTRRLKEILAALLNGNPD